MKNLLAACAIGLLAGLWESAVQPFLPAWFAVQPILPIIALFLIVGARREAFTVAVSGALLKDAFAVTAPDLAILRLVVITFALFSVGQRFLTNRSLYTSLGLVVIGRILDQAGAWLFGSVVSWLGGGRPLWFAWWPHAAALLVWDMALVGGGFLILAFFTRRFSTTIRPAQEAGYVR